MTATANLTGSTDICARAVRQSGHLMLGLQVSMACRMLEFRCCGRIAGALLAAGFEPRNALVEEIVSVGRRAR